jgi:hypothetical protein
LESISWWAKAPNISRPAHIAGGVVRKMTTIRLSTA